MAPAKSCVKALRAVTRPHAKQMLASQIEGLAISRKPDSEQSDAPESRHDHLKWILEQPVPEVKLIC